MSQWKAHGTDTGQHYAPGHYSEIFHHERFKSLVRDTDQALQIVNKRLPFDAIATCGLSGNLLGAALAYEMGIPHLVIRKACEDTKTHHGYAVTGISKGRVMLVDDLIDSGKTIAHMLLRLKKPEASWIHRDLKPVGVMLTNSRFVDRDAVGLGEREKWAQRVGKFDETGCRALPCFMARDVVNDTCWPLLAPVPKEEEVMAEELPPIVVKPVKVRAPRDRKVASRGFTIDPLPPLPSQMVAEYMNCSFTIGTDGAISDVRKNVPAEPLNSSEPYSPMK